MLKARILVVDDEYNQREMLRNILRMEGYDVTTATTGQQALDMLAKMDGAIVISDLKMPGIDGLQLLARIRRQFPNTVFVMITAHPSNETREEALRNGAKVYLTKPLDVEELLRELAGVTAA
jgi:DNA-binding response OmpR family regulator